MITLFSISENHGLHATEDVGVIPYSLLIRPFRPSDVDTTAPQQVPYSSPQVTLTSSLLLRALLDLVGPD